MDNCAPAPTPTTSTNPISLQNPAQLYPGLAPAVKLRTRENLSLSATLSSARPNRTIVRNQTHLVMHGYPSWTIGGCMPSSLGDVCLAAYWDSQLCYPEEYPAWLPRKGFSTWLPDQNQTHSATLSAPDRTRFIT